MRHLQHSLPPELWREFNVILHPEKQKHRLLQWTKPLQDQGAPL